MLKLDPKNTELLSQKQKVLNENIQTTEEKLKQLKEIKAKADEAMANGTEINEQNYRNLQREIIATQTKLSDLKNEASNWTKAGDKLIQWGENLDKVSQKIDSLGSKLTTSLTLPITAAVTAGLTYDAQIEKYETAFKTFLGSSEKAGQAIKNIKDDAKRTPFDTTSLVKANQMLISTGASADDARSDILALGEAIVATGGGNDELVRMASNLQQIKNAGKATAMDIRQFAYAGIDVYGILADYTGKSTKDVKKMDISYKDLTKALKKASSNGGKYFGAMANSSETLTGQVSALKSEVQDMTGELVKSLMPTAKKVVARARELIKTFDGLSDSEKENIVKIGLLVAAAGPALKMASSAIGIIGSVSKGIGTFSKAVALAHNGIGTATGSAATLAKVLQGLTSPAGLAAASIAGVTAATVLLAKKHHESITGLSGLREEVEKQTEAWKKLKDSRKQNLESYTTEISNNQRLASELDTIVDKNGKIKKGYELRAKYITGELSKSLGTEIKLNGNVIRQYDKAKEKINELILAKKAEALMNVYQDEYQTALKNQAEATKTLIGLKQQQSEKTKELIGADGQHQYEIKQTLRTLGESIKEQTTLIGEYGYTVENYENLQTASVSGSAKEIQKAVDKMGISWSQAKKQTSESIEDQLLNQALYIEGIKTSLKDAENANDKYQSNILKSQKETNEKKLKELEDDLIKQTSTIESLSDDQIATWKALAQGSFDTYKDILSKLPTETADNIQKATGVVAVDTTLKKATENLANQAENDFKKNFKIWEPTKKEIDDTSNEISKDTNVSNSTKKMAQNAKKSFKDNVHGRTWGTDLTEEVSKGMTNSSSKSSITSAASKVAKWISQYLHFSIPDKGPLSDFDESMPDMIDLMIKGVNSNKKELERTVENLSFDIHKKLSDINLFNSKINTQIIDSTKTVFTTPQINFYPQQMTEENMKACFNYINRKFGSAY